MSIASCGVIGSGQMGSGIAQVAAVSGLDVILQDISESQLERALGGITRSLHKLVAKERLSALDRDAALARISTTTSTDGLAKCDLIIEAATENEALKLKIFEQMDAIAKPGAILATNTSSISITRIAAATSRPESVVGMHFFNPVPIMKLVEIIRGLDTSEETYATTRAAAEAMGKTVVVAQDAVDEDRAVDVAVDAVTVSVGVVVIGLVIVAELGADVFAAVAGHGVDVAI